MAKTARPAQLGNKPLRTHDKECTSPAGGTCAQLVAKAKEESCGFPLGTAPWSPLSPCSDARKSQPSAQRTPSTALAVVPPRQTLSGGRGGGLPPSGSPCGHQPSATDRPAWTGRPRQWLPLQRPRSSGHPRHGAGGGWRQRLWRPPPLLQQRRSSPQLQLRLAPTTRRRRGESGTTRHNPRYRRRCGHRPQRRRWRYACAHSWRTPAA